MGTHPKRSQHRRCFVLPQTSHPQVQKFRIPIKSTLCFCPKALRVWWFIQLWNHFFTSYFFSLGRTKLKVVQVSFLVFTGVQGLLYKNLCKTQHYSQIDIFGINTLEKYYLTAAISFDHQWKWKSGASNLSKKKFRSSSRKDFFSSAIVQSGHHGQGNTAGEEKKKRCQILLGLINRCRMRICLFCSLENQWNNPPGKAYRICMDQGIKDNQIGTKQLW